MLRRRPADHVLIHLPGWRRWRYFRCRWRLLRRRSANHILIHRPRWLRRRTSRQNIDVGWVVLLKLSSRPCAARRPALCRRTRLGRVNRAGNRRPTAGRFPFSACDDLHSGSVSLRVASYDFCPSNVSHPPRGREHLPLCLRLWSPRRGGAFLSRFFDVRARGNVFVLRASRRDDRNCHLGGWRRLSLTGELWCWRNGRPPRLGRTTRHSRGRSLRSRLRSWRGSHMERRGWKCGCNRWCSRDWLRRSNGWRHGQSRRWSTNLAVADDPHYHAGLTIDDLSVSRRDVNLCVKLASTGLFNDTRCDFSSLLVNFGSTGNDEVRFTLLTRNVWRGRSRRSASAERGVNVQDVKNQLKRIEVLVLSHLECGPDDRCPDHCRQYGMTRRPKHNAGSDPETNGS